MNMMRCVKNLHLLEFEYIQNKREITKEEFILEVIKEINGSKYLYEDFLIGAIDFVSHKYRIICKESYKEVFDSIKNCLQEVSY